MSARKPNFVTLVLIALCSPLVISMAGCASDKSSANSIPPSLAANGVQKTEVPRFFGIFSPYRPDIQQGNFVSQEMMAQLKEGMTQDQVRFLMGTPLLTDMFHEDRWDYIFRLQKGTGETISSRVTIFFKDKRVARYEGGNLPSEKDFLNLIVGEPKVEK
jgi:outer membrane protein assembly factor BamE